MAREKVTKKVTIINYGTRSAKNIEKAYKKHQQHIRDKLPKLPEVEYEISLLKEKDILNLKEKDPEGKYFKSQDIVHHGGSRIRKLRSETSEYVSSNTNPNAYELGTCHGAQYLAKNEGFDSARLAKHHKGNEKINYSGWRGYKGEQAGEKYIHKNHRWGIPVTDASKSKLEAIATSKQRFDGGKTGEIYEVYRIKGTNKIGMQGHGEQGAGKKIFYDTLSMIHDEKHGKGYKKANPNYA